MCRKFTFLLCLGLGAVLLTSASARADTYDIRIATGTDDAEEYVAWPSGLNSMSVTSTDLEMPYEIDGNPPPWQGEQVIGLR